MKTPARTSSVVKEYFGCMNDGRDVDIYRLTNKNGMRVSITTLGAIVTELTAPDNQGVFADVVLGFDNLGAYLAGHPNFGAIVGRYGNRIAHGTFTIGNRRYVLAKNNNGHHLHGGVSGFDKALWKARSRLCQDGPQLQLSYQSPDGDEGYPGKIDIAVDYTLTNSNELRIDYRATTDKPTPINLTNHSYFNLAGAGTRSALDHIVHIDADCFTAIDADLIPTGELRNVDGTAMDFRKPMAIGERIDRDDEQLHFGHGYDHNWVLRTRAQKPSRARTSHQLPAAAGDALHPAAFSRIGMLDGQSSTTPRPSGRKHSWAQHLPALATKPGEKCGLAARVVEPVSGRVLEVFTSEPGLQFYSANFLDGSITGKENKVYGRRCAFCLETQHFPDSPNKPDFPSTILYPKDEYRTTTIYKFLVSTR